MWWEGAPGKNFTHTPRCPPPTTAYRKSIPHALAGVVGGGTWEKFYAHA
nr:MAG TPA: hypothetical protein [Caudoviricetes sp.]